MKVTNKFNLPSPFIKQAELRELDPKRMWVTQLIGPPLIRQLRIKHHDELTVGAEDCITALTGSGGHGTLEVAGKKLGNCIVEQKWVDEIDGWELVGITDLWEDGIITDYKFCKVWKYIYRDTTEWEAQQNILRWQWLKRGIDVNQIRVLGIFVDWMQGKTHDRNYPPTRHYFFNLKLWDYDTTVKYVRQRLKFHSEPAKECTPEEKWEKPTTYAVMKKGRKSALRVLSSLATADTYCHEKGYIGDNFSVEKRPGKCIRCEDYCSVSKFCPYLKKRGIDIGEQK